MIQRNVGGQTIGFALLDRTTGLGLPGLTPVCVRDRDGSGQVPVTGTVTDAGNGQYILTMSAADCNAATVSFLMSHPAVLPVEKTVLPFDATVALPGQVGRAGAPSADEVAYWANATHVTGDGNWRFFHLTGFMTWVSVVPASSLGTEGDAGNVRAFLCAAPVTLQGTALAGFNSQMSTEAYLATSDPAVGTAAAVFRSSTGAQEVILCDGINQILYTPAVPGNWSPAPTDVMDALDQLAVGALFILPGLTQFDAIASGPFAVIGNPAALLAIVTPSAADDVLSYDGTDIVFGPAPYTPATPANWAGTAPTTLPAACDRLAAWIGTRQTVLTTLGLGGNP